jgi:NAD(P)H-quinone oxidoreductase subunit 6
MTLRFADKLIFGLLGVAAVLLGLSVLFFAQGKVIAFYLLGAVMLTSAVGVVVVKDLIRSAFLLALSFLCVGGLYVLLQADFLAAAQILIYAGAVAILFVFGVMLTRREQDPQMVHSFEFRVTAAVFIGFGLLVLLVRAIFALPWPSHPSSGAVANTVVSIASVVLLMALIGAIVIARKENHRA